MNQAIPRHYHQSNYDKPGRKGYLMSVYKANSAKQIPKIKSQITNKFQKSIFNIQSLFF